jgi:hypothetical protein
MKDYIVYFINYLGAILLSFSLSAAFGVNKALQNLEPYTLPLFTFLILGLFAIIGVVMIILPKILNRKMKYVLLLDVLIMFITWYFVSNFMLPQI